MKRTGQKTSMNGVGGGRDDCSRGRQIAQWTLLGILLISFISVNGLAQDIPFDSTETTGAANTDNNTYSQTVDQAPQAAPVPTPQPTYTAQPRVNRTVPADLSGLGKLAPFNDVAVISRRYLPKTNRFEFFPNLGVVLNDAFFNDFIIGGRVGYYFSENYGLELNASLLSTSSKSVTSELLSQRDISTQSFSTPTSFYGADFKWDPIYGKVALMGKKIVPFDFYFSGGAGVTGTNQNTTAPTLHIGAGQLFAISKWLAARWDLSYYIYNSTSTVSGGSSQTFSNLYFTIGASFFFPQAGYR